MVEKVVVGERRRRGGRMESHTCNWRYLTATLWTSKHQRAVINPGERNSLDVAVRGGPALQRVANGGWLTEGVGGGEEREQWLLHE